MQLKQHLSLKKYFLVLNMRYVKHVKIIIWYFADTHLNLPCHLQEYIQTDIQRDMQSADTHLVKEYSYNFYQYWENKKCSSVQLNKYT